MKKNKRKFTLSVVTPRDEKLLYGWSNERLVRRWSFNHSIISFSDHKKWFKKNINNTKLYMWKLKYNSYLCGLIRIELIKKNFRLSYLISSKFRGLGFGSQMICIAINKIRKKKRNAKIYAKSLNRNIASHKTLIKSGFKLIKRKKNYGFYVHESS